MNSRQVIWMFAGTNDSVFNRFINTSLQRGVKGAQRVRSRFNGFSWETVKNGWLHPLLLKVTSLKRGVNEIDASKLPTQNHFNV